LKREIALTIALAITCSPVAHAVTCRSGKNTFSTHDQYCPPGYTNVTGQENAETFGIKPTPTEEWLHLEQMAKYSSERTGKKVTAQELTETLTRCQSAERVLWQPKADCPLGYTKTANPFKKPAAKNTGQR